MAWEENIPNKSSFFELFRKNEKKQEKWRWNRKNNKKNKQNLSFVCCRAQVQGRIVLIVQKNQFKPHVLAYIFYTIRIRSEKTNNTKNKVRKQLR